MKQWMLLVGCCGVVATVRAGPIVETAYGPVEGKIDAETGTQYFWGIPFASPPVGDLRFAPPVAPKNWTNPVRTTAFQPPECPQISIDGKFHVGKEDCLTLDVYRPSDIAAGEKLPVMVWIYGGGFVAGSEDAGNGYNGKNLAKKYRTIVVAMNYRLGNLGFLALDSLMKEHDTTGNYGLLDQQFALKWVQANIGTFGGDKTRVGIFGESAGGCSVVAQLSMPGSKGLFHSATAESALPVSNFIWTAYKNATAFGEYYAKAAGCSTGPGQLACLRKMPLEEVLSPLLEWRKKAPEDARGHFPRLAPVMAWWPTIDGTTLPKSPIDMARTGGFNDVPFMMGTNHDEGTIFIPLSPLTVPVVYPITKEGSKKILRHFMNSEDADKVQQQYAEPASESETSKMARVLRDFVFSCPARYLLRALQASPTHTSHTYTYQFNQTLNSPAYPETGDYHGSEIPYVFNLPAANWLPADHALSAKMSSYWTTLVGNKVPTAPGGPTWDPYHFDASTDSDNYMALETPPGMGHNLFKANCDFWDKLGYNLSP